MKWNDSGSFKWIKSMGGTYSEYANRLAIDKNGNISTCGIMSDTAFFGPGVRDTILFGKGMADAFTQKLTACSPTYGVDSIFACGSYTWSNGQIYSSANNTAKDTIINSVGCDSILTLNLTLGAPSFFIDTVEACNSYTWINGVTYTSSNNTAVDTLTNSSGCDSIITLNLTINQLSFSTEVVTACDSYMWNGITYISSTNMPTDTLINSVGCDSIINLDLTINTTQYATDVVSECSSYTWIDGITYTSNNNMATDTLQSVTGCDSIVTLDLTILQTSSGIALVTACDSYNWNGITYTSSNNTAIDTLVNAVGCDSIVTLDLTILNSTSSIETITTCDSYTSPSGNVWTSSGIYMDTIPNLSGCDSVVTINLTINNTQYSTDVISSCGGYAWVDGVIYTSNNNTAKDTLLSSSGCDSIVTLDLTILDSTSSTDVISSCNPIVWLDGVVYSQTTNGPTSTLINSQGCDSVVTLDFTLLDVDTVVTRNYLTLTAQATNATYQWIDCLNGIIVGETNASFIATVNGNYQVEVTQNGCVDRSACFEITNVGVQEAELIGISLYPNPTSDVLHIDKGSHQLLKITITNSAGAMVYQSTSKKQITSIDMSKKATGIYVVTLKNELGIKVEKVVKR